MAGLKKTIVGKRLSNYTDKAGQPASGVELYFTGAAEEVEGVRTGEVFIKAPGEFYNIAKNVSVGSKVYIFKGDRGRFEGIEVVETPSESQEAAKK